MGFVKEKYTKEYFTGKDADGNKLGYGAEGMDEWENGGIYSNIKMMIDAVPLEGKAVLELGYGRGESTRYMFNEKHIASYVGIDFSDAAYELAKQTTADIEAPLDLNHGDALEFLKSRQFENCFDVIFMLDVIEHIPQTEMAQIRPLMRQALKPGGLVIVHTPYYQVDEDFVSQGFYKQPSMSDLNPATLGMHCNKFTKQRLFREFAEAGLPSIDNNCPAFIKPKI